MHFFFKLCSVIYCGRWPLLNTHRCFIATAGQLRCYLVMKKKTKCFIGVYDQSRRHGEDTAAPPWKYHNRCFLGLAFVLTVNDLSGLSSRWKIGIVVRRQICLHGSWFANFPCNISRRSVEVRKSCRIFVLVFRYWCYRCEFRHELVEVRVNLPKHLNCTSKNKTKSETNL